MIKNKIVLVPFPFDDFTRSKVRPALCLSNFIGDHDHVVIAFISSRIPDELLDTDIVIRKDSVEFPDTGLIIDSVIRVHKLVTIPKSLIKRELGTINNSLQEEVLLRIGKLFY
jgi:mRNA interferase MazF